MFQLRTFRNYRTSPKALVSSIAIGLSLMGASIAAHAQEKVVFATNWKAHADHGGFYQALVDGTYKKYGLDVEIQQGGPMVNNRPMLPAGKVDFLMTGNLLQSFENVKNGIPTVVVAAFFQKDPQAMFAHPGQGYDTFKDMANAPVAFIGGVSRAAICSTRSTMLRRSLESLIRVNARVSARPSEVARKSET